MSALVHSHLYLIHHVAVKRVILRRRRWWWVIPLITEHILRRWGLVVKSLVVHWRRRLVGLLILRVHLRLHVLERIGKHVHRLYLRGNFSLFLDVKVDLRWTVQVLRDTINFRVIIIDFIKFYGIRAILVDKVKSSIDFVIM